MGKNHLVLLNILIISLLFTTCLSISFPLPNKMHVTITNRLPGSDPPLYLHCKSRDNDLGTHILLFNQSYDWSFRMNWPKTTLFSCDFWWLGQHQGFVVFDEDIQIIVHNNQISYEVRNDGFYLFVKGLWRKVRIW